MKKEFEKITGIKPEIENNMVNVSNFLDEYKKMNPKEFKNRFGTMTEEEIINQFLVERFGE